MAAGRNRWRYLCTTGCYNSFVQGIRSCGGADSRAGLQQIIVLKQHGIRAFFLCFLNGFGLQLFDIETTIRQSPFVAFANDGVRPFDGARVNVNIHTGGLLKRVAQVINGYAAGR